MTFRTWGGARAGAGRPAKGPRPSERHCKRPPLKPSHLLVEAGSRTALARGMQGFEISAAKHLNAAVSKARGRRRRGAVFPDRYHARI
jgi:hypothetical protein